MGIRRTKFTSWVPKPVTNYIHLVKTTKRAALSIENPEPMFMGQSQEDHEKARDLAKIFRFEWDRMKARKHTRDILETSKLLGTGIAQVYYEDDGSVLGGKGGKHQGVIGIRQIDPASFYPDPNAFRIEDCEFIHIVRRRPISWIEKEFGKKDIEPSDKAHQEQGEIYNRDYTSETKDKIVDFHEHYEKVPHEEGGFMYQVTYLAGNQIVRDTKEIKPSCYPFAILYDYPQRQDFWGMSISEVILDNQKLINKVESIMAFIGVLLQNPQKVVAKQSGIDPKEAATYGSAPGHVWTVNGDPTKAIHWQEPPQIPQQLFNLADQARMNIREITGLTEAYMGQTVGSLQTSSGVHSLIERSTMRDRDQMYDYELFIGELTEIIISFITEYYTEKRIARVVESDDQEPTFMEYIGSDFSEVEFDIKIDISAKAPITRVRKQEELDKLLTLQGQMQFEPAVITPQEYMRESDFVDAEKFITRMNLEEIQGAEAIMQQVLEMMIEAQETDVPPEEIAGMAEAMLQARFEEKQQGGTGDTSENAGDMQLRQGDPSVNI